MKSLKRLTLGLSKKYIIMIALYGLTSGAFSPVCPMYFQLYLVISIPVT